MATDEPQSYRSLPDLADVYLEDSWVLDVQVDLQAVTFDLDVVLCETHPDYTPPRPDEHYSYRRGKLIFEDVKVVSWTSRGARPAIDATGALDYGNIDSLTAVGFKFLITGEWGIMDIDAQSNPHLIFDSND